MSIERVAQGYAMLFAAWRLVCEVQEDNADNPALSQEAKDMLSKLNLDVYAVAYQLGFEANIQH